MKILLIQSRAGFKLRIHGEQGEFQIAISGLKSIIPHSLRRFDNRINYWIIGKEAEDHLLTWLLYCNNTLQAEIVDRDEDSSGRQHRRGLQDLDHEYATLHLLPSAPDELVRAAYRILISMKYPDGDDKTVQRIKGAIRRIAFAESKARLSLIDKN